MKKDLTLLVLAAGMGSRFGGLKQIEPVGPNDEFIIDYSVYDAIRAGFTKVVFVIKEENYDVFKETIGARIEDKIKVEYAFQKIEDVPDTVHIPEGRIKPLGTAHAVYAARNLIHENFAIINADDFYGKDGFIKAAEFLRSTDLEYGNVVYELGNTMSKNGSVKRGVVYDNNGILTDLIECVCEYENDLIKATPLYEDKPFYVEKDTPVSMNLLCFTPKVFEYLINDITNYFNKDGIDLNTIEYLIPNVLIESAKANNSFVRVIKANSKFYGMTYREDLEDLKNGIKDEIEKGNYNNNLWG